MNRDLIQEIFENKINFYIFKLDDLNDYETEMLISHLKSKIIIKNPLFERLMNNEITKIEQMIETEQNYKKYITIIIQYLINENKYTTTDIQKIIQKIQTFASMAKDIDGDIEMKCDDDEINERLNEFIHKLDLGENENTIKYVKQLTTENYLELRELLYISSQEDIDELLNMIIHPFIKCKFEKSEKYVADDLILKFLSRLNNDKFYKYTDIINEKIIEYLTNDNRMSFEFLLTNTDIYNIHNYIHFFKKSNNQKLKEFLKKLRKHKQQTIIGNRGKNFVDYSKHRDQINISGLHNKKDQEMIEILYIIGKGQLKMFLKELKYEKYLKDLQKINILTFKKLEDTVLDGKLISLCRKPNFKIIPGKALKKIIFTVLNNNNKLEMMKKIQEKKNKNHEMEILELKFDQMCINECLINDDVQREKNIKELKQQKINIQNLIILLRDNNEDVSQSEKELNEVSQKIKNLMLKCDTQNEILDENINELAEYLENNLNLNVDDRTNINAMMKRYQRKLTNIPDKKYGQNFIKDEPTQRVYNQFDQNLTNIIDKFDKEDKKEQKVEKKRKYHELQNEILTNDLKLLIKSLDNKHNSNLLQKYDMLSNFLKYKMIMIMPFIYKNLDIHQNKYQKNNAVYSKLRIIIHTFLIISCCMNKNLDYNNIYDTTSHIIKINKPIKNIIIKCNGKKAELLDQIGEYYIIRYLDTIIELKEDEIEFVNDLKGKTCKIIKGNYKGFLGVIYEQKNNYVLLTKDLYGKNSDHHIPLLPVLKLPIDHIKVVEKIENEKIIIENKELFDIFNKKSKNLYSLVKFELNKKHKMDYLSDFDLIYKFSIELFNNYKIIETEKFSQVKTLKQKYLKIKKDIKQNKNNKRVYIKLNKELKRLHHEIRQNEKTTKFIKNSLFNNFKNLNDNYIFNKNDDGVYQLKEYEIKKSTDSKKLLTKAEKINNEKLKIKEEKERMVNEINNCKNDMTSLLNNLL
jgi:hypothetical protein